MLKRLVRMLTLCLLALLAFSQGATRIDAQAAARAAVECGDVPAQLLYEITVERVSCAKGRTVARQWASQCAQLRTGSCLVTALFFCRFRSTGHEAGAIRCIDERDLLRTLRSRREVRLVTGV